jgi:hypothetical protein
MHTRAGLGQTQGFITCPRGRAHRRFEDQIQLLGHFEGDGGLADGGRVTTVSNRCVAWRRNTLRSLPQKQNSFSRRIAGRNLLRRINPIVTRILAECRHLAAAMFFVLELFADLSKTSLGPTCALRLDN